MFAAEARGELPRGTARRFVRETRVPFARLPEHAHHSPVEPAALSALLRRVGFFARYPEYEVHSRTGQHAPSDNVYFVAEHERGDLFVWEYNARNGALWIVDTAVDFDEAAALARQYSEEFRRTYGSERPSYFDHRRP
jgi:hypothetical protein